MRLAAIIGGFLAVAVLLGWLQRGPGGDAANPCPSTYSKGPYGAAGFYELLDRLDLPHGRWHDAEPPRDDRTYVIAMPTRLPILREEARALLDWTATGGTLVLFFDGGGMMAAFGSEGPAEYMQAALKLELESRLNVRIRQSPPEAGHPSQGGAAAIPDLGPRPLVTVDASIPTALNAGAPHLAVEDVAPSLVPGGSAAVIPLYVCKGMPHAVEAPYGRGRVIIVTSAAPLQNARILEADNLAFVANLARVAGARGIWFDEYHQGYRSKAPLGSVVGSWAFAGEVILACAAMILFVFSKGRRFGPARPPVRYSRRHVLEYVRSVAGLYRRGASRQFAAAVLLRALARRLKRSTGAVEASDELGRNVFKGTFAERMTNLSARVSGAIAADAELVDIVRSMDDLEREALARDKT